MYRLTSCLGVLHLLVLLAISAPCFAEVLPDSVSRLFPNGYTLMTYAPADLNKDGRQDYVVVLRSESEEAIVKKGQPAPRRPLLVFLQDSNGVFTTFSRNDNVVFAADQGGQCDPFLDGEEGIVVKSSYFTVQNSVACGDHWTEYFTFRFAQERGEVVFHKRITEHWIMNPSPSADGDALVLGNRRVSAANKSNPIPLGKYQP